MNDKCMMCGATENLQTHHWAYGDDQLEEEWTITICVECHQKIHVRHGVGHGVGSKNYQSGLPRKRTTLSLYLSREIYDYLSALAGKDKTPESEAKKWIEERYEEINEEEEEEKE